MTEAESWTVLIAAATAVIAVVSIGLSIWFHRQNRSLIVKQTAISEAQNSISNRQSEISLEQNRISKQQITLSQRQLLVPLWEYIGTISRVVENGRKADWNTVVRTANNLELLALCWEGQVIDEELLKGTLRKNFIEIWAQIEDYTIEIENKVSGQKDVFRGKDLIPYCRAAKRKYDELVQEDFERDRPSPME